MRFHQKKLLTDEQCDEFETFIKANNELTTEFKRLTAAIPIATSEQCEAIQVDIDNATRRGKELDVAYEFLKYPVASRCGPR
jgi:hypothetical protein